jgi:hypothetical protein
MKKCELRAPHDLHGNDGANRARPCSGPNFTRSSCHALIVDAAAHSSSNSMLATKQSLGCVMLNEYIHVHS